MNDYFFELPVYSMKKDVYKKKMKLKLAKEKDLYGVSENLPETDDAVRSIRRRIFRSWEYNQIIGYLKLYRLGNRVYADFWKINKSRIPFRLDNKYFEYQFISPEWDINLDELNNSEEIFNKLVEELPNDMREMYSKYYLDLTLLKEIGPYINWFDMINRYR